MIDNPMARNDGVYGGLDPAHECPDCGHWCDERLGCTTCGMADDEEDDETNVTIAPTVARRRGGEAVMHECECCGFACDCDGEDTWFVQYENCRCDCCPDCAQARDECCCDEDDDWLEAESRKGDK